jgi:hypothetical protein
MKISWKRNEPVVKHTYAASSVAPVQVKSVWNLYHRYSVAHENQWNPYLAGMFFFQHFAPMIPRFGCNCTSFFNNYCKKINPQFESPEAFRLWGIDLHNAVNAKLSLEYTGLDYPQITLEQYRTLWMNESPRKSNRLVITVATGQNAKQLLKHTRPKFAAYAARCDADYIELTNEIYGNWHLEKLRVGVFADQYDQTLFLDVDCFPTSKCRNLFEASDKIAVVNDWDVLVHNKRTDWIDPEYRLVMQSQDIEPEKEWTRCLNTGVVLCSRTFNPWIMPPKPLPGVHCAEQIWVDSRIGEFDALPETCNWQWWRGKDFWRGLPDAEIIHFANCPREERLELVKWATQTF